LLLFASLLLFALLLVALVACGQCWWLVGSVAGLLMCQHQQVSLAGYGSARLGLQFMCSHAPMQNAWPSGIN